MYRALSDILHTFSDRFPVPWALLTVVTVLVTSLGLYLAWEWLGHGVRAGRAFFAKRRGR